MAKPVRRSTPARPEDVWRVLADGWTFASWVVGASRVRAVSAGWPARGSLVHHSVGGWPAVVSDNTEVLDSQENRRIVLAARFRPLAEAKVEVTLRPTDDGGCEMTMREDIVTGPLSALPEPVRQAALRMRNSESLDRLAYLAERRTEPEK